jgi:hypothetical protein
VGILRKTFGFFAGLLFFASCSGGGAKPNVKEDIISDDDTDDIMIITSAIIRGRTSVPAFVRSNKGVDLNHQADFFEFDLGEDMPADVEITAQDEGSGIETSMFINVNLS